MSASVSIGNLLTRTVMPTEAMAKSWRVGVADKAETVTPETRATKTRGRPLKGAGDQATAQSKWRRRMALSEIRPPGRDGLARRLSAVKEARVSEPMIEGCRIGNGSDE